MNKILCAVCAVLYLAVLHSSTAAQQRKVTVERGETGATIELRPGPDGEADMRLGAVVRLVDSDLIAGQTKTVDVDVRNVSLREALKAVLAPAKIDYRVDDDVPADARVTIVAKNVRLRTVLDLLAQAAGVGWQQELDGAKFHIRFSKAAKKWDIANSYLQSTVPGKLPRIQAFAADPTAGGLLWRRFAGTETRSTITCPHCKSQMTAVRERTETKCPKCGLVYEEGWKLCPRDGTKRPESGNDWKYCPICGKVLAGN